jgi:hypothetical protein
VSKWSRPPSSFPWRGGSIRPLDSAPTRLRRAFVVAAVRRPTATPSRHDPKARGDKNPKTPRVFAPWRLCVNPTSAPENLVSPALQSPVFMGGYKRIRCPAPISAPIPRPRRRKETRISSLLDWQKNPRDHRHRPSFRLPSGGTGVCPAPSVQRVPASSIREAFNERLYGDYLAGKLPAQIMESRRIRNPDPWQGPEGTLSIVESLRPASRRTMPPPVPRSDHPTRGRSKSPGRIVNSPPNGRASVLASPREDPSKTPCSAPGSGT